MNKYVLPIGLGLALIIAGYAYFRPDNVNSPNNFNNSNRTVTGNPSTAIVSNTAVVTTVSYSGENGKTALELLKAKHTVVASDEGFVGSINGVIPVGRQFWAFYVNGEQAQVGAKEYQTKNSESIEWKLESY